MQTTTHSEHASKLEVLKQERIKKIRSWSNSLFYLVGVLEKPRGFSGNAWAFRSRWVRDDG